MKKSSLTIKTLFILSSFLILLLLSLWVLQIQLTGIFYEKHQIQNVEYVLKKIKNSNFQYLDLNLDYYAYKYDMCIEYFDGNTYNSYNTKKNGCILNKNNKGIIKYKNELINSKKNYIKIYDKNNKIKSILYYIKLNDANYIFLNSTLDNLDPSFYYLQQKLIYLILVVIIISIIISIFVSRILNRPIIKLTQEAKKLGKGEPVNFGTSNVAEIDELASVLTVAASEMNKTNELRKDLIANVSHDLKTPLTMIKAYAEKVRDLSYNDEEKRNKDLNIIIAETDRLNNLVNDLLDLSKMESGMDVLKLEEYDLVESIHDILKRYDIIVEKEGYVFELDLPKTLIIKADKQKMEQVIYNLINNAIEHTDNDLKVIISINKSGLYYKVAITDTGGTLSESDKSLVWNKYYKKEKNHKRNVIGTGLGLSIVKNVLEAHNFVYGIDSKKDKYTSFYFKVKKTK